MIAHRQDETGKESQDGRLFQQTGFLVELQSTGVIDHIVRYMRSDDDEEIDFNHSGRIIQHAGQCLRGRLRHHAEQSAAPIQGSGKLSTLSKAERIASIYNPQAGRMNPVYPDRQQDRGF